MQDLTQGPVSRQVLAMAAPIAVGMIFQTLYFLIDLYFVGRLGTTPSPGSAPRATLRFVVMALTQVLAVGTVASRVTRRGSSRPAGRQPGLQPEHLPGGDRRADGARRRLRAHLRFYMHYMAADAATAAAGTTYLAWYLPGLALQFAVVGMASALRGTGIVKPTMLVQVLTS